MSVDRISKRLKKTSKPLESLKKEGLHQKKNIEVGKELSKPLASLNKSKDKSSELATSIETRSVKHKPSTPLEKREEFIRKKVLNSSLGDSKYKEQKEKILEFCLSSDLFTETKLKEWDDICSDSQVIKYLQFLKRNQPKKFENLFNRDTEEVSILGSQHLAALPLHLSKDNISNVYLTDKTFKEDLVKAPDFRAEEMLRLWVHKMLPSAKNLKVLDEKSKKALTKQAQEIIGELLEKKTPAQIEYLCVYGDLHKIVNYILSQEEHHKTKTFKAEYLDFLEKFEIEYNEKYLFEWIE